MRFPKALRDGARRAYLGLARATLVKADDKPQMQELTVKGLFGEEIKNVEYLLPYGFTAVPKPPANKKEAEVVLAYLQGGRSHPIALGVMDRRYRPKDWKEGEVALHDDQGQRVKLARDVLEIATPKKMTITSDVEVVIKAPKIVLDGNVLLGGADADRPISAKDTIDSGGNADTSNLLTKVKGK